MEEGRAARVVTPLERTVEGTGQREQVFLLYSMRATERLGEPYVYDLELLAEEPDVDLEALVGERMHVQLRGSQDEIRHFHGHVTEISRAGQRGRHWAYRVRLEPWLALLEHNLDCRIYQHKGPVEVVRELIDEAFFDRSHPAVHARLNAPCDPLPYVVQYQETDLAFFSRLLESAGIYYYFEHDATWANLVLADGAASHARPPRALPYLTSSGGASPDVPHLAHWQRTHRLRPGVAATRAFDVDNPRADLTARRTSEVLAAGRGHKVFRYPGKYLTEEQGERFVENANLRDEARRDEIWVETTCRELATGQIFEMSDHPLESERGEYLVVASEIALQLDDYETGQPAFGSSAYRARLQVAPLDRRYLPELRTPRPVVGGPQTATVVGAPGEEIHGHDHVSVKVRFHWDPSPTRSAELAPDHERTCWVRVSQSWAGAGFGAQFLPRVGDEVVVAFLEGDPDRPLVVGSVYDGANHPPYDPATRGTRSGIRTRSSPGGAPDDGNEIRFEDERGNEELYVQAQNAYNARVKGSQSVTVGGSRTVSVGVDQTTTVTGDEKQVYGGRREMTVAKDNLETVEGNHVGTYQLGRAVLVQQGEDLLEAEANRTVKVTGHDWTTVTSSHVVEQGSRNRFEMKGAGVTLGNGTGTLKIEGAKAVFDNGSCRLVLDGPQATLQAASSLTIEVGGCSITLGAAGVEVKGLPINLN